MTDRRAGGPRGLAGLVVAAVLGAGIALGAAAGLGAFSRERVVEVVERAAAPSAPAPTAPPPSVSEPAAAPPDDGRALTINEIYRRDSPGVVQVTTSIGQEQRALGSGFVIDADGHIVTNYHVVEGADSVAVNFSDNAAALTARIVGVDPSTDLAVLKVQAPADALVPLQLGDSDRVRVGDLAVAIGNPFGLDRTVTAGIVSAVQRYIQAPNGYTIDHVIQTDAALNHGNSGGPLLDSRANVIGVNAQIASESGGNEGVGYAIPVNTVRKVVSALIADGRVEHPYLGVEMAPIDAAIARVGRLPVDRGVLIQRVRPQSPAERAGLRGGSRTVVVSGQTYALGGDVVTRVDGRAVASPDDLASIVSGKQPGDRVVLDVRRGDQSLTITVTLGTRPAAAGG